MQFEVHFGARPYNNRMPHGLKNSRRWYRTEATTSEWKFNFHVSGYRWYNELWKEKQKRTGPLANRQYDMDNQGKWKKNSNKDPCIRRSDIQWTTPYAHAQYGHRKASKIESPPRGDSWGIEYHGRDLYGRSKRWKTNVLNLGKIQCRVSYKGDNCGEKKFKPNKATRDGNC